MKTIEQKSNRDFNDFAGEDIYCGIDMHKKIWNVSIFTKHGEFKRFPQDADALKLMRYLHRIFPGGNYHCAYEAGYSGFVPARQWLSCGIEVVVANPADIPTTSREQTFKRNTSDASKIARNYQSGHLRSIYIPTEQIEDDRAVVRSYETVSRKQTRVKNQIKALLTMAYIAIPEQFEGRTWTHGFLSYLDALVQNPPEGFGSGYRISLENLLAELRLLRELKLKNLRSLRALAQKQRYKQDIMYLCSISGIGPVWSIMFLLKIGDIRRFPSLDKLASYAGLVPGSAGSGSNEYTTGLTKRRSAELKRILVESAWIAKKKDPSMMLLYENLIKRMKPNQAIIRVAKKQLGRMRYVLLNKCMLNEAKQTPALEESIHL